MSLTKTVRARKARFYADENVSPITVKFLKSKKINIKHSVLDFNFGGRDDLFHFNQARIKDRVLLTLDSDFIDRKFIVKKSPGIILLVVTPPVTSEKVNKKIASHISLFKSAQSFFKEKKIKLSKSQNLTMG